MLCIWLQDESKHTALVPSHAVHELRCAISAEACLAGESASESAADDGQVSTEPDGASSADDVAAHSSSDDEAPAVQPRAKRAAVLVESDDDESLDLD